VFVPTINQTETNVDLNLANLTNVLGVMSTGLVQI
jgi:hypothetical protein